MPLLHARATLAARAFNAASASNTSAAAAHTSAAAAHKSAAAAGSIGLVVPPTAARAGRPPVDADVPPPSDNGPRG
ncbi:hypothetical protein [Nonomuraea jabiensis]|uniref:hypothetical protein n=1 Tax=Nonomuraea jabiensis TaxID=882448 RepID=UPI0036CE0264